MLKVFYTWPNNCLTPARRSIPLPSEVTHMVIPALKLRHAAAAVLIAACGVAQADIVPYFGLNTAPAGQVSGDPLTQSTLFEEALVPGTIVREGFGGVATGSYNKFDMAGLGATISRVNGPGAAGQVVNNQIDGSEGRFDTSGDGQWWLTAVSFRIDFDADVSAFGFYGTDFGDFAGSFLMELLLNDGSSKEYDLRDVMAPANSPTNGWLQFIGVVDDTNSDLISGVRFSITQGSTDPDDWDFLGFDSFVVGEVATSTDVPEPGSLALVGASLLALGATRRRRQQA